MKKLILLYTLFVISVASIAQNTQPLISAFLNSSDFAGIQNFISPSGIVSLEECNIKYYEQDFSKPTLNIVLRKNGKLTGIIEVLPLPIQYENVLPNNSRNAMQLIDYSNYDVSTKTGTIKTIDLNYDQYTSAILQVRETAIDSYIAYPMPVDIKAKYIGLKRISEINRGNGRGENRAHFCDSNGNNNVSFGECMGCMQNACNGNSSCAIMCWIVNVAGIGSSIGGQCSISMGAACLILSIMY